LAIHFLPEFIRKCLDWLCVDCQLHNHSRPDLNACLSQHEIDFGQKLLMRLAVVSHRLQDSVDVRASPDRLRFQLPGIAFFCCKIP
jgi:hypothetical protein